VGNLSLPDALSGRLCEGLKFPQGHEGHVHSREILKGTSDGGAAQNMGTSEVKGASRLAAVLTVLSATMDIAKGGSALGNGYYGFSR